MPDFTSNIKEDHTIVSDHDFAHVILNHTTGQKSVHATGHSKAGDKICTFHAGTTLSHSTVLTLQIGEDKHITLLPDCLQYTNHSCAPNVFFDTTTMELICIKDIKPGDEFAFFYPSTEWDMAQPFNCYCGAPECLGVIQGAAHLSWEVLNTFRLTDFIRNKKLNSISPAQEC